MYLYNSNNFKLDPNYLKLVHLDIFKDILENAGNYRTTNLSRKEDCLHFRSVIYSPFQDIEKNLDYDFNLEKTKHYKGKSLDEKTVLLSKFLSNIWQAHPFSNGNTRTDMIFIQKYLEKLQIDYDPCVFDENFVYFRNALVRSCYNTTGFIKPTYEYLYTFIYNLLTGNEEKLNID